MNVDKDILQAILETTDRKFRVQWEKTMPCKHVNHVNFGACRGSNSPLFNKAIIQLRRTWTDFLSKWFAGYDWRSSRIEGYIQCDFIDGEVYLYRYHSFSPRFTFSLADPNAFPKIGQEILRLTKDR